ncbi:MAG: glycosyltransferase [Patescibacteria group bacterium]
MKIEFCLPVYNESQIIQKNLAELLKYCKNQDFPFDWQIVLIVNGSNREFEELAKRIADSSDQKIKTVIYQKDGKGRAIKKYASESSAEILVYMDSDLAVSLENLPMLINPIIRGKADLVIGSRMLPTSKRKRSWPREASSRIYVLLSQLILRHRFSDMQCGFKAIKLGLFIKLIPSIHDNYWFFDTELIYFAKKSKATILEIPVDWSENRYQLRKSKISIIKHGLIFVLRLIQLRLRRKID